MRLLFTVSSWPTHYSAMVPLGWALQAAGHEVRVLCTPTQVGPVSQAALPPVPVLDGMDVVTRLRLQYYEEAVAGVWPYPWLPPHPLTGERLRDLGDFDVDDFRARVAPELAARAARSFDAAVEFARAWRPDLVLHDPASLEGLLAAQVVGVPAALCLWGPVGTHEPEHMRIVPTDHSGSFPRHGLGEFDLGMIERVVDPCPDPLAPPTAAVRLPVRYVPYNGNRPAPTWLLHPADRPRVCVTWSTALSTVSGPDSYLLPEVIHALRGLDCDVIVTATAADVAALGPVPVSVRVVEHVPLRMVLPQCDVVVHHGGSGSAMTALCAGIPQFIATFAAEQTVTGQRVAAAGAGRHALGHLADRETIRDSVGDLLSNRSYRVTADRLRREMLARPTPATFVESLEELAAA
ncbi:UDP:flavonoid glycosyltransferase YjiC, YdhE family [Thermomonospora echinospora]|uniref:UDP:flavonoid glycosyltransferase YjiC, YdhE family n=1 Tax=Thermomonospora echinospora TaxID=1992 RepID=A0A1H5TQV2_9ACTN|nr:nucleotide disphospho-sugar-binding domain-containing protein [Thermomonospora echinospora]SEF65156.1 UDP:flavonoid glycosyltransferase YjiC, YdhE family [Thermomonospora echinospora]